MFFQRWFRRRPPAAPVPAPLARRIAFVPLADVQEGSNVTVRAEIHGEPLVIAPLSGRAGIYTLLQVLAYSKEHDGFRIVVHEEQQSAKLWLTEGDARIDVIGPTITVMAFGSEPHVESRDEPPAPIRDRLAAAGRPYVRGMRLRIKESVVERGTTMVASGLVDVRTGVRALVSVDGSSPVVLGLDDSAVARV